MHVRTRATAAVAAVGAALATAAVVAASPAQAAPAPVPTITIRVSNSGVHVVGGNNIHAGRVLYRVVSTAGDHIVNFARFQNGYTLPQFSQDIGKAFGGDTKAIKRVDRNTIFRGGAEATPSKPGAFSDELPAGKFLLLDQNTFKYTWVYVHGTKPQRATLPNRSKIVLYSYGFEALPSTIPHQGWTLLTNKADQPHFLVFQHIKKGVTRAQLQRAFRSNSQPSFLLPGETSSGVLSQGQHQGLYYNLPPGRYVVACFWPDFRTGMNHASMGMFRQITLT